MTTRSPVTCNAAHPCLLVQLFAIAALAAVAACQKSSNPATPSAEGVATSVTVSLAPVSEDYQATALVAFADGSRREVTTDVQWTSSNASVASVSSIGRVTPLLPGVTEIRATYQSIGGTALLTINLPATPNVRVIGNIRDALDDVAMPSVRVMVVSAGQSIDTSTDAAGSFEIRSSTVTPSSPITITTRRDGYRDQSVQRMLTDGEVRADFRLDPLPLTLRGVVRDNINLDVPYCEPVRVEVLDGPDAGRSIVVPRVPADGSYQFPDLQPGTVTVRASAPGYRIRQFTARLRGFTPLYRLDFSLQRGPAPSGGGRVDCTLPPLP